jgi:hypothetical protein
MDFLIERDRLLEVLTKLVGIKKRPPEFVVQRPFGVSSPVRPIPQRSAMS